MLASCRGDGPLQEGEVSVARPPSRPAPVPAETLLLALHLRGRAGFFSDPKAQSKSLSAWHSPREGQRGKCILPGEGHWRGRIAGEGRQGRL